MPLATALIVAAAAYQVQKKVNADEGEGSPPNITPDFLENKTSIELLPLEQSLTMLEWPISTVSFYQCTSSNDNMNVALEKIERRVQAILRANPWLGGWLVRGKGIGLVREKRIGSFDNPPRLWYDPTGNEMAPTIFQKLSHDDFPLDKDTPYTEYETILSGSTITVKTNPEIVNRKEEPLFRITIIPSLDNNEFALIASMSHICGDGHSFYRIYNMLLGSTPIVSLIPQRELLFSQKLMELMGRQEAHYISHITTDPAWMKLFRMGSRVEADDAGGNDLHGRIFLVNRHWIGNIKASLMTEGNLSDICTSTLRSPMTPASLKELENDSQNPTHSTNDILVSFFWNLVNCNVGLMTVNFRGRLDIVSEDHMGNYANPIPYTKEDYKNATLIRKSLDTCRRAGTVAGTNAPTTLPRANPDLTFSVITNWSSFPPTAQVERTNEDGDMDWNNDQDMKLIRHLPIIYPKRMIKKMPRQMSMLIIFSSGKEDIGCMLIAPGRVMEEIDSCGVVKEKIAEF